MRHAIGVFTILVLLFPHEVHSQALAGLDTVAVYVAHAENREGLFQQKGLGGDVLLNHAVAELKRALPDIVVLTDINQHDAVLIFGFAVQQLPDSLGVPTDPIFISHIHQFWRNSVIFSMPHDGAIVTWQSGVSATAVRETTFPVDMRNLLTMHIELFASIWRRDNPGPTDLPPARENWVRHCLLLIR